jgi:hypothetical protein
LTFDASMVFYFLEGLFNNIGPNLLIARIPIGALKIIVKIATVNISSPHFR